MTENKAVEDKVEDKTTQSIQDQDVPLPEPSLKSLVSGLAAQAMISLGVFPNPIHGSTAILLNQGKHLIETIAMLDEKTQSNKTPEEVQIFENVLHELRMVYVAAKNESEKRNGVGI